MIRYAALVSAIHIMPELRANDTFAALTRQQLAPHVPEFRLEYPFDCSKANEPLDQYFDSFGFSRMQGIHQYFFGFLQLKHYKVAAHFWRQDEGSPTVFIAHGLFDHVGLYLDLVQTLVGEGFNVLAIDFPGHGLSDGEPAVIRDFSEYTRVVDETLDVLQGHLSSPLFAVGQSTGGAVLLHYVLARRGESFTKLVLLAPLIRPRAWFLISIAHAFLARLMRFIKRNFTINSHRKGFPEFLAKYDPLQPKHISVEWIGAMKLWIKSFDTFDQSPIPTLVVQGNEDGTVDWKSNLSKIESKFRFCETHIIHGAMHHLVKEGEAWQSQVFAKIRSFLCQ